MTDIDFNKPIEENKSKEIEARHEVCSASLQKNENTLN